MPAVVRAQPAAQSGNEAAAHLWRSFLETYDQYSLQPLDPPTLDAKARAALIATAGPKFRSWKPDARPTLPELAAAMAAEDASVPEFTRIERALEALLPQIDRYGSYKSAAEVSQRLEVMRKNRGSVQMTLDQAPDGRILCYPHEEGPAEQAGINPGAVLLAVDQSPAEGKNISAVSLAFVGPPGTPVTLKVRQPQGKTEEFTIVRTDKPSPKVAVTKTPLGLTLRIRGFEKGSALQIKNLLQPHPKPGRMTIDLRGNPGGERDEAFKVASLFFPEGTPLGTFTTRTGSDTANDGNGVFVEPASIRILQDGRTASAAEYLIAALMEGLPGKVTLFGEKTYGKSHSTAGPPLAGGGKLTVTETLLSTASGHSWDKTGIPPDQASGD
jgi:carboxyl-terminal processing protease